jgi:hypothetical protein
LSVSLGYLSINLRLSLAGLFYQSKARLPWLVVSLSQGP